MLIVLEPSGRAAMRWRKLTVASLALGLIVSALYVFLYYKGIYNYKSAATDFGDADEVCNDYLNPGKPQN